MMACLPTASISILGNAGGDGSEYQAQPSRKSWGRGDGIGVEPRRAVAAVVARLNFDRPKPYYPIGMKQVSLIAFALWGAFASAQADTSESVLHGMEGVGLKVLPLHLRSNHFDLDTGMVRAHAMKRLEELQVSVLSDSELSRAPGRPYLEIGVNVAQAQGPSHLYSIDLRLREMAALERPKRKAVSMALSTWERESIGVANRPEAILQTVDRMLRVFSEEFHKTNVDE